MKICTNAQTVKAALNCPVCNEETSFKVNKPVQSLSSNISLRSCFANTKSTISAGVQSKARTQNEGT